MKRYSKDYNLRRQNGKTVDLEEDYPDYVDKFEFIAYVIDKNVQHLDHEVPNPKMFDKIIDDIDRIYSFLNCKGNSVISPSNILDALNRLDIEMKCKDKPVQYKAMAIEINHFMKNACPTNAFQVN